MAVPVDKDSSSAFERHFSRGFAPVSDDLSLYYELSGPPTAPILVLIHGGGSNIDTTWSQVRPHLEQHFRIVAMDLQAHGRTKARAAGAPLVHDAEDVAALLRYLKIENAHVFGFSKGGISAMELAVRYPSLLTSSRLIVSAIGCRREGYVPGFWDGFANAPLDRMPQVLQDSFLALNNGDREALQRMHDTDVQGMLAIEDWSETKLAKIQAEKTLVLTGFRDLVTPEHAIWMSRTIQNAECVILRGTHGEFLADASAVGNENNSNKSRIPELAAELVREFLS